MTKIHKITFYYYYIINCLKGISNGISNQFSLASLQVATIILGKCLTHLHFILLCKKLKTFFSTPLTLFSNKNLSKLSYYYNFLMLYIKIVSYNLPLPAYLPTCHSFENSVNM